jgi:hypothetical protein
MNITDNQLLEYLEKQFPEIQWTLYDQCELPTIQGRGDLFVEHHTPILVIEDSKVCLYDIDFTNLMDDADNLDRVDQIMDDYLTYISNRAQDQFRVIQDYYYRRNKEQITIYFPNSEF